MANDKYQICNCCVMDTTDEDMIFDSNGVCMRCNEYNQRILPEWNYGKGHEKELTCLIEEVKQKGIGKEYDCLFGLSGGLDSCYLLHLAIKEWGLRPYVIHIDTGWNLPVTEENIKRIVDKLGVKLHIKKMDWDEMREMQLAWFRTGLESLDVPQDHGYIALLDDCSCKLGIKYILNGYNIATEIVQDPASWAKGSGANSDGVFFRDVIKKYCRIPIKHFSYTSGVKHKFWIPYVKGVKTLKPLNLVEITRKEMVKTLEEKYGYITYEQKHFENLLTKFIEGWWQPTRFGHDLRRVWLSSLVMTKQMSRDEALKILEHPPLSEEEASILFSEIAKKLDISEEELMKYHDMPKSTEKFKSQEKLYNWGIKIFEKLGLEKRIRK